MDSMCVFSLVRCYCQCFDSFSASAIKFLMLLILISYCWTALSNQEIIRYAQLLLLTVCTFQNDMSSGYA